MHYFFSFQAWKEEAEEMNKILEHSNGEAQKMTAHADADMKYAAYKKRWVIIDETAKDWFAKYEKMVEVWKKQAETAAKVTAAIAAPKGDPEKGMLIKLRFLLDFFSINL